MKYLISYGSQYGSTKHYALKFGNITHYPVCCYTKVKTIQQYDGVIHFGALYAGGVKGLKTIVSLEPKNLIIVTVGLADPQDHENVQNIKSAIASHISKEVMDSAQIFHLRGAIVYQKLSIKHRIMMKLLYKKANKIPLDQRNAETQTMIDTYNKEISFVDDAQLNNLKNNIDHLS